MERLRSHGLFCVALVIAAASLISIGCGSGDSTKDGATRAAVEAADPVPPTFDAGIPPFDAGWPTPTAPGAAADPPAPPAPPTIPEPPAPPEPPTIPEPPAPPAPPEPPTPPAPPTIPEPPAP